MNNEKRLDAGLSRSTIRHSGDKLYAHYGSYSMNRRYCHLRVSNDLLMIGLVTIMLHTSAIVAAEVIPLGDIHTIRGISDDGTIVFGQRRGVNTTPEGVFPNELVRWTRETGMQVIINDDVNQNLGAMSADGSTFAAMVNVVTEFGADQESVIWNEDTGFVITHNE